MTNSLKCVDFITLNKVSSLERRDSNLIPLMGTLGGKQKAQPKRLDFQRRGRDSNLIPLMGTLGGKQKAQPERLGFQRRERIRISSP